MLKFYMMRLITFILLLLGSMSAFSQSMYFPPLNQTDNWDTLSPTQLSWCPSRIDSLYLFLDQEKTKGFIVLKDGKIVLEKYFGTFTQDSIWYWASASKTLTGFMIGQAQEQGLIDIQNPSSNYLGSGWSACTPLQENDIKVIDHLRMSTGLNDNVADKNCVIDTCLKYLAQPDTRWAYHNAPYLLLKTMIENISQQSINQFTTAQVKNKIAMTGIWAVSNGEETYYSKVRSMARFGLLIQNNGIWNNDTLLKSSTYKNAMLNTSQTMNLSYGYLWWLNGKASHMLPGLQTVFPTSLCPNAPTDMIAAIGKNGQLISIAKSRGLVIIRMGEDANTNSANVSTVLLDDIWQHINGLNCEPTNITPVQNEVQLIQNPVVNTLKFSLSSKQNYSTSIFNMQGNKIYYSSNINFIDVSSYSKGMYLLQVRQGSNSFTNKFLKE